MIKSLALLEDALLSRLIFFSLIKRSFSWRILSSKTLAGSSLGSCGTSFPCIAHCNMLFFNCFPFIVFNQYQISATVLRISSIIWNLSFRPTTCQVELAVIHALANRVGNEPQTIDWLYPPRHIPSEVRLFLLPKLCQWVDYRQVDILLF